MDVSWFPKLRLPVRFPHPRKALLPTELSNEPLPKDIPLRELQPENALLDIVVRESGMLTAV